MTGRLVDRGDHAVEYLDSDFAAAEQVVTFGEAYAQAHQRDMFGEVADRTEELPNDRYTTRPTLAWCKKVLGVDGFDLDVAACVEAHHAPRWFRWDPACTNAKIRHSDGSESTHDGIAQDWDAQRIWCNPPYDDLSPWVSKAWLTMLDAAREPLFNKRARKTVIGMLIPDNRREQPFWQQGVEPWRDGRADRLSPVVAGWCSHASVANDGGARLFTHSLPGRQAFGVPGNPEGVGQASPPFGVVLLEWRFA